VLRTSVAGSPYVGVFARATASTLLVRRDLDTDAAETLAAELDLDLLQTTVGGSATVGALAVSNENGVLVSSQVTDRERDEIANATDVPVVELPGRINAAGNVVVANDYGAYVHPELTEAAVDAVEEALDVPVLRGSLGDRQTVGTAAVATNEGVLCHPQTREAELETLEDHLDVYADLGTVNYGAPLIGSGLVAGESSFIVGEETTGPEIGRIEDTLGYIE